jgi:anti-sigma factor RsiW
MKLTPPQLDGMMRSIGLTRPQEIDCDACAADLAEFAEVELAGRSLPEALQLVEHHLAICPDCREEYTALRTSILALGLEAPGTPPAAS